MVEVLVFQADGLSRLDTKAIYEGNLDRNINFRSATLCMRIKLYYLHGLDTFFALYDRQTSNISTNIKGEIFLDRVRPVFGNTWIFHLFPSVLETLRWYQMCFTYDDTKSLHTTYLNGEKIYSAIKNLSRNMFGDYAYIGQGGFRQHSLSGEITQLNIWKEVISEDRIQSIAKCLSNENGNYISWNSGWRLENIESYNIEYQTLCRHREKYYAFGFKNIYFKEAYYICKALGSRLPTPTTLEEIQRMIGVADEMWPNRTWFCEQDFFTPLNDAEKEGTWVTYFDDKPFKERIPWGGSEPNGLHYENCAHIAHFGVYDVDCTSQTGCAFCEFSGKVIYSLRGACQMAELRDAYFLAHQNELDHLAFRSYGKFKIENKDGIWQWTDITKNLSLAKMIVTENNYPMGRRNWTLLEEVCEQSSGTRELTLTSCNMNEFTCNDGKCILLTDRCDLKYDCYDRSDEKNCELISFPADYKRDLPPRGNSDTNNSLLITLKALIESVSVDTALMEIRVSFILQLFWSDNRLKFINLKDSISLNGITQDFFPKLWLPFIGFMNTIGNAFSEADREAFMFVNKLENMSKFDDTKSQESYLFSGEKNPFVILRRYMSTFSCEFDLVFYPFDEQSCGMEFQILNAPKQFLLFDVNNTMAENTGSNMLIEYEVGTLSVKHLVSSGYSRVKIIVPLKRRAGFTILNIYIPSLCFVTITYLTLFIRSEIFDVRVMGSLTTLLVVATLLNQVSSYLPKTSYFKAIDIWLLFCTSVIFLVIVFHVLIDIVAYNSDEDERKQAWTVSNKGKERVRVEDERKEGWTVSNKGKERVRGKDLKINKLKDKVSVGRLILISRIAVLSIFALFNFIYWGIILKK
ncbi:UNVERIFIED_CONTAM: hypothetical protein RMT77_014231 [Armadillidium vulgare]